METATRSIGGRSARTSHNSSSQTGVSAEEAFAHRQKLQLGSEFQVIGDLRNWTRGWSHDVDSTVRFTDFTRVLCWNVGGSSGTLKDPDKLSFIAFTLIQQGIHVACLTESGIRRNDLTAGLRRIGLDRQFRAFGFNGKISWLVREPVADKVVSVTAYLRTWSLATPSSSCTFANSIFFFVERANVFSRSCNQSSNHCAHSLSSTASFMPSASLCAKQ